MKHSCKPNDVLLIELVHGSESDRFLSGRLVFCNASRTRFEFDRVRNLTTDKAFQSVQRYCAGEIRSLSPIDGQPQPTGDIDLDGPIDIAGDGDGPAEELDRRPLTADEAKRIDAAIRTAVHHVHADRPFCEIVAALQQQHAIALHVSVEFGGLQANVGLLSIACPALDNGRVHHFDALTLSGLPEDLRQLLQADRPLKLMHDSALTAYALDQRFGVRLGGVFDVGLARAAWRGDVAGPTPRLAALLDELLAVRLEDVARLTGRANERPLSEDNRMAAGRLVAYLPVLYDRLVFDGLLGRFMRCCAGFVRSYADEAQTAGLAEVQFRIGYGERMPMPDGLGDCLPGDLVADDDDAPDQLPVD